ncbi:MAG: N,N-dimethylformamidase beta subunit family domain-containing protein [Streptosporangiaceae bacterium]
MAHHSGPPGQRSGPSRRRFIGLAAGAAGAAAAAVAADKLASSGSGAKAADAAQHRPARRHRQVSENSLPGNPRWRIRHLGKPDAMLGYAGQASVLPGEPITLYASTTARSFTVSAFRMGWYGGDLARLVWKSGTVRGHQQRAATFIEATRTVEARWDASLIIATHHWPEGSYLLRLDSEAGDQRYVPVTVRSASISGKTVIKNCVATWQAYNTWGGYDLYHGPGGAADYANRSYAVSLDRPYAASGAQMFLWDERKFIALAERTGLPLAYTTSMDIAGQPGLLDGASALFSLGHDEYWSPPERANVTAARNAGTNIGFMGANCCFRRTRLASTRLGERRLVICYKTSYMQDPMYGKDNALVTSDWRDPPHPDPESSLIGTLYESNPVDAAYVVATPDAWMFKGTGVQKGTRFAGLVGIEYDRVNPDSPIERPIQILSHSPLTCRGVNSYADSAYYTHHGGAGVFNSGTMRWVYSMGGTRLFGLNDRTAAFTRHVTVNLLTGFADGPAAAKHPAHDNLAAMQEWAGDPIAAQHNLWPPIHL